MAGETRTLSVDPSTEAPLLCEPPPRSFTRHTFLLCWREDEFREKGDEGLVLLVNV